MKSKVNWRAVRSDVAQMPWNAIVRRPVMVEVLDAELGKIIEDMVLSVKDRRRFCDETWFDELCGAAFQPKQAVYHRWRSFRTPAK